MTLNCRQQASLGDALLRVAVSWPGNPGRIQQEWLVLGSQRLTQLRDRLYCRTDLDMKALGLDRPSGAPVVATQTLRDDDSAASASLLCDNMKANVRCLQPLFMLRCQLSDPISFRILSFVFFAFHL